MIKSLLERFDINVPNTLKEYNLIGLDFGDGEISAAVPFWNSEVGKERLDVANLVFNRGLNIQKIINVYAIDKTGKLIIPDPNALSELKDLYYNFKRLPDTEESRLNYRWDNGIESEKTYEDAMAEGFNATIRALFQYNPTYIDKTKNTIILVGRPSSTK